MDVHLLTESGDALWSKSISLSIDQTHEVNMALMNIDRIIVASDGSIYANSSTWPSTECSKKTAMMADDNLREYIIQHEKEILEPVIQISCALVIQYTVLLYGVESNYAYGGIYCDELYDDVASDFVRFNAWDMNHKNVLQNKFTKSDVMAIMKEAKKIKKV